MINWDVVMTSDGPVVFFVELQVLSVTNFFAAPG